MDQLNLLEPEELDQIRAFLDTVGGKMFAQLQGAYIAEWMVADAVDQREACWRMLQATNRLQSLMSDAKGMNDLTRRARERLYDQRTKGV